MAAKTEYLRLGSLKREFIFLTVLEARSKIKVSADSLKMVVFAFCLHVISPLCLYPGISSVFRFLLRRSPVRLD